MPAGFNEIKKRVIECILKGLVQHEARDWEKNLYAAGVLTDSEVIAIIQSCKGDRHEVRIHHFLKVPVHIMKPVGKYDGYYVKFYFNEPDAWFISVHKRSITGSANGYPQRG